MAITKRLQYDGDDEAMKALVELRNAGMTQADVAKLVGVSKQAVCFWEKGKSRPSGPSAKLLMQLAGRKKRH